MNANRYSESQVLYGLREVWPDVTGADNPFDADTQIYTFMKADGSWDDLDFADIFRGLERFFGFTCTHAEWRDFLGFDVAERSLAEWDRIVVPRLTFGALARFIADRAPAIASFDPISVFGRDCAPAGVFTGIQQVANNVTGNGLRFAPSTPIIDVMRGHNLDRFWTHTRWMTEHSIPELPAFWRGVTGWTGCLGVLAVICAAIAAWATSDPDWIIPTIIIALACYVTASTYKRLMNPLPSYLATFRDLSMLIAKSTATRAPIGPPDPPAGSARNLSCWPAAADTAGMRVPLKGFLEKRNPRATRRSVIIASLVGSVLFPVVFFLISLANGNPIGLGGYLFAAITGAIALAAIEWQEPR